MDDDDDDFAAFFEEFNADPEDAALSAQRISGNLRALAGLGGRTIVHEGEADEGRVMCACSRSNEKSIERAVTRIKPALY